MANMAAAVLQVSVAEKQQLLTTHSIGDLLDQIAVLLQREGSMIFIPLKFPDK